MTQTPTAETVHATLLALPGARPDSRGCIDLTAATPTDPGVPGTRVVAWVRADHVNVVAYLPYPDGGHAARFKELSVVDLTDAKAEDVMTAAEAVSARLSAAVQKADAESTPAEPRREDYVSWDDWFAASTAYGMRLSVARAEARHAEIGAALGTGPLADAARAALNAFDIDIDGRELFAEGELIVDDTGEPSTPTHVRHRRAVHMPEDLLRWAMEQLAAALAAGARI